MRRKRHFWSADVLLLLLTAACVILAVLLVLARPAWLLAAAAVLAAVLAVLAAALWRVRAVLRRILRGSADAGQNGRILAALTVPMAALSGQNIIWYNRAFTDEIAGGADFGLLPIEKVVPGMNLTAAAAAAGQDVQVGDRRFTVHAGASVSDSNLCFVLFNEDTWLKFQAAEYQLSRPAVIYFVIDTYDEVLKEMRESDRAVIMSHVDVVLERFVGKSTGFLRRITASRYLAVVEERHLEKMIDARFDILDEVRTADENRVAVTLSIGVGHKGNTFKECEEAAVQALDMALGRGGDQAAVKSPDSFEFYGGVSRSVEKRTKVKSRVVAAAIRELMAGYDKVLVMGHKSSDMDSVGAAVGMLRFCRICSKPVAMVVDEPSSLAPALLRQLRDGGYGDYLLGPDEALSLTGPSTLAVVVDTHIRHLLESSEVYAACGASVVIDHHRLTIGHIDDAVIFHHEPYASSASELVSELLQYAGDSKDGRPLPIEAEALLSGIMLDTRTFSIHVGVRTFEAAAWLRRMGAQTAAVKKLFATSMDEYLYRSHLVGEAKFYHGCAVTMSDRIPVECEVVAPQAANELLGIEGVDASFVGILSGGQVRISARSMGEVNVQLIMEKLGGGGHLTMAGAQVSGCGIEEAAAQLENAITSYMKERTHDASVR